MVVNQQLAELCTVLLIFFKHKQYKIIKRKWLLFIIQLVFLVLYLIFLFNVIANTIQCLRRNYLLIQGVIYSRERTNERKETVKNGSTKLRISKQKNMILTDNPYIPCIHVCVFIRIMCVFKRKSASLSTSKKYWSSLFIHYVDLLS